MAVLAPAAGEIVVALKRVIDVELGKEGKEGSVSEGLMVSYLVFN
jgi:hypothetical protein